MIRHIIEIGDPVLRSISSPVAVPCTGEVRELARDMADTLKDFQKRTGYGRGIAAPQVGVPLRMIVVDMPELVGIATLVNPHITRRSPEMFDVWDACFSYFYLFFLVERHQRVTVEYDDLHGTHYVIEAAGDLSELLQHEIEHLDGELAIDKVKDPRSFCTVREFGKRVRKQS